MGNDCDKIFCAQRVNKISELNTSEPNYADSRRKNITKSFPIKKMSLSGCVMIRYSQQKQPRIWWHIIHINPSKFFSRLVKIIDDICDRGKRLFSKISPTARSSLINIQFMVRLYVKNDACSRFSPRLKLITELKFYQNLMNDELQNL